MLPNQRWQIASPQPQLAEAIATASGLSPLLAQVLINRGMDTPERSQIFLDPESEALIDPKTEFPDLKLSLDLLEQAAFNHQQVAICGDYDADGMTSTALLLRTFRLLGIQVSYEIPSRMHEGYGINLRMVEELHKKGVALILTVDNGIAAYDPIARARALGLEVIITDHHDLPPQLPPASAILNPKLINPTSPYAAIAGVGVAYILALELCDRFGKRAILESQLLELFTLGTIADLASLTGINRRLVKRGLRLLGRSQLPGVLALIQASGIAQEQKIGLKPEAIGFSLGPRINAVGRIGDPVTVIELLTATEMGEAITLAHQCEETNRERQQLCREIEKSAIAYIQSLEIDLDDQRVLLVVQSGWHHGVIGIVASRLVERYGVPVFIGTYEEDGSIRGSVRSIPEFNVFEALEFCKDLLKKYGGHPAAGGFSMAGANLDQFSDRLRVFAHLCLKIEHLKPLVKVDVKAELSDISLTLLSQIDALHPCGMGNSDPIFYSSRVRVISQQARGKDKNCLALELDRGNGSKIKAIAWRWGEYYPVPNYLDLAYKLRANHWQNQTSVELELIGIRLPELDETNLPDFQVLQKSSKHPDLEKYGINYLYYITSISHLADIVQNGLLSPQESQRRGLASTDILAPHVQNLRSSKVDPCFHRSLDQYVSLHFSARNPVLYTQLASQEDMIILGIEPNLLWQPDMIFTDGYAAVPKTSFYQEPKMLDQLPWQIIHAKNWVDHHDAKRIKCAEILVHIQVPPEKILFIFCRSNKHKAAIINAKRTTGIQGLVKPDLFF